MEGKYVLRLYQPKGLEEMLPGRQGQVENRLCHSEGTLETTERHRNAKNFKDLVRCMVLTAGEIQTNRTK
jgi:hypothetical protein